MLTTFLIVFSLITPEQEVATKNYWIGFNDIVHNFNKSINLKPNTATTEIKIAIAKMRSMSIKNVDSLVLKYTEKRIALAIEYSEFLEKFKFTEDGFFKVDYPIKEQRNKFQNSQEIYRKLYDKHQDMDMEQKVLIAYLKEKYNIDTK